LKTELIAIMDISLGEGCSVQQLAPGTTMMKLVAHYLAIGAVQWKVQAFHKKNQNPIHRNIVWNLNFPSAAPGDIYNPRPNFCHSIPLLFILNLANAKDVVTLKHIPTATRFK